jgi:flagellar protein FliJ
MKSRELSIRAKRFDVAEKARKAEDLVAMARDLQTMAADLDRQIAAEEDRTGIKDRQHFSYSTFAQAASQRRDKLLVSVADLVAQLEVAKAAHRQALEALELLEADEARDHGRHTIKAERNGLQLS